MDLDLDRESETALATFILFLCLAAAIILQWLNIQTLTQDVRTNQVKVACLEKIVETSGAAADGFTCQTTR